MGLNFFVVFLFVLSFEDEGFSMLDWILLMLLGLNLGVLLLLLFELLLLLLFFDIWLGLKKLNCMVLNWFGLKFLVVLLLVLSLEEDGLSILVVSLLILFGL